ncbi:putative clathrin assembly protein At1g03050 [Rhododendron vialii]|uniref:putative clathrin assembly protein At1g03050 n=1 Tax=Rhododendron vialii TaxID=182163 RepID=UPI00265D9F45|nr:putative clathrin assembly protein At1g03050 [Rhododendron vialii]
MAPSKFRKAIGAVKDQTSIGLAKVGSSASLSDLDVAIVKATRHEEMPAEERHIREIMSLTSYSRAHVGACVAAISKRLSKTENWVVALKALMLIQRLLADGEPSYEQEIFFTTRRGTRLLNMTDFRDTSRSDSWDYSAFVRTYALYLDEQLEFRMQGRRGKRGVLEYDEDEEEAGPPMRTTPVRDMRNDRVFSRIQHLMQILERFLACHPRGSAQNNRVVLMALYPVVKESFQIYYDIAEILNTFIDRFTALEVVDSVKVHEIFCRVSKQIDELLDFYGWCKHVGIARSSEYPSVERITQKKLDVMDEYIKEKSVSQRNRKVLEEKNENEEKEKTEIVEEDMNEIKALPPLEGFPMEPEREVKEEEVKKEEKKENGKDGPPKEANLLDFGEDAGTSEEYGDKLALALFDGGPPATSSGGTTNQAWEAFKDVESWETTLVQSASHLSNQKASLPGGFDMMLLDGMYQQGATTQAIASSGYATSGSASSMAFGSAGRPAMLALPAPPMANGSATASTSADPFAASLPVPPPSYVQMAEMEKKQRLVVEEQLMWQQYARDGMQGQLGLTKMQPNPYPYSTGGFTRTY